MFSTLTVLAVAVISLGLPIYLLYRYRPRAWYWHLLAVALALGIGCAPGTPFLTHGGDLLYGFVFVSLMIWGVGGPVVVLYRWYRRRHAQ